MADNWFFIERMVREKAKWAERESLRRQRVAAARGRRMGWVSTALDRLGDRMISAGRALKSRTRGGSRMPCP